jgi:DNA-binding NtrC family response regulator
LRDPARRHHEGSRHLLVVEADADLRRELVSRLNPLGSVDEARDADEARALLERGVAYDWILRAPAAAAAGRSVSAARAPLEGLVLESPEMRKVVSQVQRVASGRSTVLVYGETGTGKDAVAGLLHQLSSRNDGPLVKVNCAALPEPLLESELFGHERGAFTGADRLRLGRFEQASRGTLLLDEIGEMSLATQVKLLRVLEEREFQRLGGVETLLTEARIVAATNRDLERAVREGRFREDLYFRLAVIAIPIAPLRERPADLVPLALHFLARIQQEAGLEGRRFRDATLDVIKERAWRGNVRELRNAVEQAVLLHDGPFIEPGDLSEPRLGAGGPGAKAELPPEGISLAEVERDLVLRALEQADWVQKEAAGLLRVSRRKLNYMIQRMGVTHPSWRRNRPSVPVANSSECSSANSRPIYSSQGPSRVGSES